MRRNVLSAALAIAALTVGGPAPVLTDVEPLEPKRDPAEPHKHSREIERRRRQRERQEAKARGSISDVDDGR